MTKPQKYTKRPVEVEAMLWDGTMAGADAILKWLASYGARARVNGKEEALGRNIVIPTLEGPMRAMPDDYIIKGVEDEFYPCRPDIFEKTYRKSPDIVINSIEVNGGDFHGRTAGQALLEHAHRQRYLQ